MAYETRSLNDLGASIRGMFRQYLPGTDASLRQNFTSVCAKVLALLSREYELRQAWIYKQLFLTTASDLGIVRMHAAEYQIFQKAASGAAGTITGTGSPSLTYPAGIRYLSAGTTYVTRSAFTANALGLFSADVVAESSGVATNRDAGGVLSLADPALYTGLSATATISSDGLGGGADAEDLESLRRRALARKAAPPQGGALSDYERFALGVPGVVAACARQLTNDVGSVGVWTLFADRPNGIPTAEDVAAVDDAVNAQRLIRGRFYAVAPQPVPVDMIIALSPDTASTRAMVTAALVTFFDARISGSRIRPGLPGEPFLLSEAWISEAISGSRGEDNHVLVEPAQTLGFQAGELPVLGTIGWV
jgi:uncharacterized phage protein gp47/JayE